MDAGIRGSAGYKYDDGISASDYSTSTRMGATVLPGGLLSGWLQVTMSDTLLRQTSRASVYGS